MIIMPEPALPLMHVAHTGFLIKLKVTQVADRVEATDRASVLTARHRKRVRELEAFTATQIELLQGLIIADAG